VNPSWRTRRALLLLVPILVVGLIGAVVAVGSRGGDAAFQFDQQHPKTINALELETLVKKAPEPTPSGPGAAAKRVACTPGSRGGQRNPWRCAVRYGSGHTIRYRIRVRLNGAYSGIDPTGQFVVRGCCVAGGTAAAG
jgi:hypothetical protein